MSEELKIKEDLEAKFGFLRDKVEVRRVRRIFADVDYVNFRTVLEHLHGRLGFTVLPSITGTDEGPAFGVLYHLSRPGGVMLTLKTHVPRERPIIETVTKFYAGVDIFERELVDLFGIQVTGLPPGPRYPLPDNWPAGEYPLRKDWNGAYSSKITGEEA